MRFLQKLLFFFLISSLIGNGSALSMGKSPAPVASRFLRVAVAKDQKELRVKAEGPYEIHQLFPYEFLQNGSDLGTVLTAEPDGIRMGKELIKTDAIRVISKQEASLSLDGNHFRGTLDIIRKESGFLVVNQLSIEKYLYGVLPHEVPHEWPQEMLEVQAILARSYAIFKKTQNREKEYDVESSVLSQHYGGSEKERRRARLAVDRTRGQVLTYQGTLFPTFYHSTCAGHTEDAKEATLWKERFFPLQGVVCSYCTLSPFYRWERSFSLEDIAFRLRRSGIPVGNIQKFETEGRTLSGRVKQIVIMHDKGKTAIPGPHFRLAVGPVDLRSLKFDASVEGERVHLKGNGWGHGVGLCQWGALGMAHLGFSAEKILSFYYPGSEIRELPNIPWNER